MDSEQTTAAESYRRKQVLALTYEQRMERAERLHREATELLMSSPEGYAAFMKRNFRERRHRPENER